MTSILLQIQDAFRPHAFLRGFLLSTPNPRPLSDKSSTPFAGNIKQSCPSRHYSITDRSHRADHIIPIPPMHLTQSQPLPLDSKYSPTIRNRSQTPFVCLSCATKDRCQQITKQHLSPTNITLLSYPTKTPHRRRKMLISMCVALAQIALKSGRICCQDTTSEAR